MAMLRLSEFQKSFILSFLLHTLPIVLLLMHGGNGKNGKASMPKGIENFSTFQKPKKEESVPTEVSIVIVSEKSKKGHGKKQKKKAAVEAPKDFCDGGASYGGIGVTFHSGGIVTDRKSTRLNSSH